MSLEIFVKHIEIKVGMRVGQLNAEFRPQTFGEIKVILFKPILSVLFSHGLIGGG